MIKEVFNLLKRDLINIVYPKRCYICHSFLDYDFEGCVCDKCNENYKYLNPPYCQKCGRPVRYEGLCPECADNKMYFDKGMSVFSYEGDIRKSVQRFKYGRYMEYALYYSELMADEYKKRGFEKADIIIAVPIHKNRLRQRGYNQSELIAENLSKKIDIPFDKNVLIRKQDTPPMFNLSLNQRKENVKDAFFVKNLTAVKDKTVLLVDDIYTTGSTINSCCKTLKKAGAKKVNFITFTIKTD